jgi:ribonuclease R
MTNKKRSSWRQMDPFLAREQEKYGRASPSREFILHYLEERGMPLTLDRIVRRMADGRRLGGRSLSRRLRAMERDGQLIRNRREGYGLVAKMNLVTGRVIGHPEGHGFLIPDEGGDNLFLSPRQMRKLLHGDRAVVRVIGVDYRGRREGAVVEVLERNTETVVGRFCEERGALLRHSRQQADQSGHHGAARGPRRSPGRADRHRRADRTAQRKNRPLGRVKEVLGEHMAPGMEIRIAIASHGIPVDWPEAAIEEAQDFGETVPEAAQRRVAGIYAGPVGDD